MNKRIAARAFALIPAIFMLAFFAVAAASSISATQNCANPIFAPVIASLQTGTNVPLRLPSVVGGEYDAALYADVGWIGSTRYVVRIGQHCERSYCPYGTVSGTKITEQASHPRGKVVELAN